MLIPSQTLIDNINIQIFFHSNDSLKLKVIEFILSKYYVRYFL